VTKVVREARATAKEVADLLVVFENHVIIFSDKHVRFNEQARTIKRDLGIFVDTHTFAGREQEYPVEPEAFRRDPVSRNSPCICGSGKRFNRLLWGRMFSKKKGRLFRKLKD
jgi:hypothetical protein